MRLQIRLLTWGDHACFTRPEMKGERLSYDVITPSAARGVLEAIYWKPEIRWIVERLHVLKPISFTNLRRNEVGSKVSARLVETAMRTGRGTLGLYVEDDRQQRAATILRDVAYVIEARFEVLGGRDEPVKHFEMFRRRAERGQCFHRPYLGCREFDAQFRWIDGDPPESHLRGRPEGTRDLGLMLHDIDFGNDMAPRFFHAVMRDGVIEVPAPPWRKEVPT